MNPWVWTAVALVAVVVLFLVVRAANRQRRSPSALDARQAPRTKATGLGSTYYKEL
jgi:heme exporter protein D